MDNNKFQLLLDESENDFQLLNQDIKKTMNKVDNHMKRNAVTYGALKGAATGASAGSAGGFVGAGVGAVVGAAVGGTMGHFKKKAHQYASAHPDKIAKKDYQDSKKKKKLNEDDLEFQQFLDNSQLQYQQIIE